MNEVDALVNETAEDIAKRALQIQARRYRAAELAWTQARDDLEVARESVKAARTAFNEARFEFVRRASLPSEISCLEDYDL